MTADLITLDLTAVALTAAAWLGAGATALSRKALVAAGLTGLGLLLTAVRVVVAVLLGTGGGWWFVQEKVLLELPLQAVTAALAAVTATRRLLRPAQARGPLEGETAPVAVPLFAAGIAALAGLVVTLLIGYPVTAAVALVTVALVALLALAAWWVLEGRPRGAVLGAGGVAFVVGIAGALTSFAGTPATDAAAAPPSPTRRPRACRSPPSPARRPRTPVAPCAATTCRPARRRSRWPPAARSPPGPTTAPCPARPLPPSRVTSSRSPCTTSTYPPGSRSTGTATTSPPRRTAPSASPRTPVTPGHSLTYRFLAAQAGTYWYHTHQDSNQGVQKGLFGSLVVTPRPAGGQAQAGAADIAVPVHTFDGATAVGDRDTLDTRQVAPGRPVLLRLINTDNVTHRFTLAGAPFTLAAVDGNAVDGPGTLRRTALSLAAGGRYDLRADHAVRLRRAAGRRRPGARPTPAPRPRQARRSAGHRGLARTGPALLRPPRRPPRRPPGRRRGRLRPPLHPGPGPRAVPVRAGSRAATGRSTATPSPTCRPSWSARATGWR